MGTFCKAAKKQDIPEGQGIVCEVSGKPIALFNVGGNICAISNTCLHRGGPLGEGELEGSVVTCPWHAWQYDVTTGCNLDDPGLKVAKYNVKVEGDDVLVEI
jgi:nitrite reductase/ring-hydroxylating ferredoxin subunit